jgi:ubiquinone/menaquinone biosynthesis C-methylase UbiE
LKPIVLRSNAVPLYRFLSTIADDLRTEPTPSGRRILDCGAGGALPPLTIFAAQGLDAWGIDVSDAQLRQAQTFCETEAVALHLHRGDMRRLPFADARFDYVYEHYSMCHLSKADLPRAIAEMARVLKPDGRCFLGLISAKTWPPLGREREPGEFWFDEGAEATRHSVFTDQEADQLLSRWEIIRKERSTTWLASRMEPMSKADWMDFYREIQPACSEAAWMAKYDQRTTEARYVHTFYVLQKP